MLLFNFITKEQSFCCRIMYCSELFWKCLLSFEMFRHPIASLCKPLPRSHTVLLYLGLKCIVLFKPGISCCMSFVFLKLTGVFSIDYDLNKLCEFLLRQNSARDTVLSDNWLAFYSLFLRSYSLPAASILQILGFLNLTTSASVPDLCFIYLYAAVLAVAAAFVVRTRRYKLRIAVILRTFWTLRVCRELRVIFYFRYESHYNIVAYSYKSLFVIMYIISSLGR